ncbi:MAG: aldo/keto reductase [Clostridiales bacterium]|nr:aldo/keto reductase [Clostridiales bacterium]
MQYVPFGKLGFDVSRLGFGMMRLPTMTDDEGKVCIDRPEAMRMLRHAIDRGVNYVDTAYGYHFQESEILTGLALKDGYREKVKLTTKLPQWLVKEHADMDRLLDEQLRKLDVPYVDFYLVHSLTGDAFHRMQSLDYKGFLKRALKDGRIRHTGFSFHDEKDVFIEIVDDFDWELAQIQFNYLDDENQATLEGLRYAGRRGIPVVCMEPLRGGAIANPPQEIRDMMMENPRGWSPVEWAFRYAGDFPEVVTILSGMNSFPQVEDNLDIFSRVKPGTLTSQDHAFIREVKEAYLARIAVGCTQCNYCQPCPEGVLIPRIFAAWNGAYMFDNPVLFENAYRQILKEEGDAARCVACGQCEAVCPQQLPIIELLQKAQQQA